MTERLLIPVFWTVLNRLYLKKKSQISLATIVTYMFINNVVMYIQLPKNIIS